MPFNKRILIKPAAILLVSSAILGYSVWKNRGRESVSELAEMKQLLKTATAKDASAVGLRYSRLDNALFRKKKFAEIRRLNELMRNAEKEVVTLPPYFFDFSDYMSYIGERDFAKALDVLEKIEKMPNQDSQVRGAILGERVRCVAELKGIDAATAEFNRRIAEATQAMFRPAYTGYINTLYRYDRHEAAIKATLEAAERILPEPGTPPFVSRLGGDLVRLGFGEKRLRELLPPEKRFADYSAALFNMADACFSKEQYSQAEELLADYLQRPNLPDDLRRLARMKLNLCLEKKKGPVK